MTIYGLTGGDVLMAKVADPDAAGGFVFAPSTAVFEVRTTRTGSTVVTGLQDLAGSALAADHVTPDANGRVYFQTTGGEKKTLYLYDVAGSGSQTRWAVQPTDSGDRIDAIEILLASGVGYVKPGTGIPLTDLDAATQAKINGAIQNTGAATSLVKGNGSLLAIGAALQHLRVNAAGTALEYAAEQSISGKADKAGSIGQFADVTDAAVPGGYEVPGLIWDYGVSSLVWVDLAAVFASLDAGRLRNSQRPKYNPDLTVIVQGDALPGDFGADVGGIWFEEAAAPSIVPVSHGANGGINVVAATGVTKATTSDINPGDWLAIPVGASGEATLPSTYTVTLAAGAVSGGFTTQTPAGQQAGSAQCDWIIGRCTTLIPSGTNVTVKANQNRVELLAGVISIPNLANPAIDQAAAGAGASSTTLNITTTATGTLAQPDEVALLAVVGNVGNPVIRSYAETPGSGWIPLFAEFDAVAAGSARGLRAFYQLTSSTAAVQGKVTVTTSDGQSGAFAMKLITLKA